MATTYLMVVKLIITWIQNGLPHTSSGSPTMYYSNQKIKEGYHIPHGINMNTEWTTTYLKW